MRPAVQITIEVEGPPVVRFLAGTDAAACRAAQWAAGQVESVRAALEHALDTADDACAHLERRAA